MPPPRPRASVRHCRPWVASSKAAIMDAVATLAFEVQQPTSTALTNVSHAPASVYDVAHFNAAFAAAGQSMENGPAPAAHTMQVSGSEAQGFRNVMTAFENLNGHAES